MVFLSSSQSDGALGGPRGADEECARLARSAGLGGYWMSWTSDDCTSPLKRFEKSTDPYYMRDGTRVSWSWARMTIDDPPSGEGYLDSPIDTDESGTLLWPGVNGCESTTPARGCTAWTNTTVQGRVHPNNGCLGLTSNDPSAGGTPALFPALGITSSIAQGWTQGDFVSCSIDSPHLYCFEQSEEDPDPMYP